MRLTNCDWVWICSPLFRSELGRTEGGYTGLRKCRLYLQYMDNEMERRVFGEVTSRILVLASRTLPDVKAGDALCLREPAARGVFTIDEAAHDDYGPGDYEVLSVVPARPPGPRRLCNPTTITARAWEGGSNV